MVGVQVLPTLCFYHHYMCIYADLVRQYDELKLKDNKFYDVELDFPKLVQFTPEFQFSTHCRIRHGLGTLHGSVFRIKASQITCIKRMLSHLISCSYKNGSF